MTPGARANSVPCAGGSRLGHRRVTRCAAKIFWKKFGEITERWPAMVIRRLSRAGA